MPTRAPRFRTHRHNRRPGTAVDITVVFLGGHDEGPQSADVNLTRILELVGDGEAATDELAIVALYDEIRRLARGCMRKENAAHTLAPTALANEAWLRLFGTQQHGLASSAEFFSAAATTLRRILVEHGRRKSRQKRGGQLQRSDIDADSLAGPAPDDRLLELDEALERLANLDPVKARLVELRFFTGLSIPEAAGLLGMSERTAARDWRVARAFLHSALSGTELGE